MRFVPLSTATVQYLGTFLSDLDSPWMINDAFLEGYGEYSSAFSPEEDRRKKRVYNLLFALTDAYVWRVEYCSENNYQSCLTQAKSILQDK